MNSTQISIMFDDASTYNVSSGMMKSYPNWRVVAKRVIDDKAVVIRRRFNFKKFGGNTGANMAANAFANHMKSATDWQFVNARRRTGRPFRTEYLATPDLTKA